MHTHATLRVGFVGAGANTRLRHIPGFRAIPGVELTVVANRSEASSRRVASEFGFPRIARDWREIVEASDVDAVCIGTWPYLHAEVTIAALRHGKHVLMEARMARNVAEADAMCAAAREHPNLVAQIVPAPMSLDLDSTIARLIAEGAVGSLREVCLTHTGGQFARADVPMSWRQDVELSGCNTLTVGIYYEMVRRWIDRDPTQVLAHGRVFTAERNRPEGGTGEVGIPESVSILGDYESGARFVGHFSGVEAGAVRNEVRLNGSAGSLRIDLGAGTIWLTPLGESERVVTTPAEERRGWRVESDFVDSIRTGAKVKLTSFEDGLRYMRFTEVMFESWKRGSVWLPV